MTRTDTLACKFDGFEHLMQLTRKTIQFIKEKQTIYAIQDEMMELVIDDEYGKLINNDKYIDDNNLIRNKNDLINDNSNKKIDVVKRKESSITCYVSIVNIGIYVYCLYYL